jgi:hypothetical protein
VKIVQPFPSLVAASDSGPLAATDTPDSGAVV